MSMTRCDSCERLIDSDDDCDCFVGDEILCEWCRDNFEKCNRCSGTGEVTVRSSFPMSYVCPGEPPEEARGVIGVPCADCRGSGGAL